MRSQTSILIKSGFKVVGHPKHKESLEAKGCCMLKLTRKQTEFLSLLIATDSLGDSAQDVPCEMLSQVDGLKEALKCKKIMSVNKTAEKLNPFGEEECNIAAGIDKMIKNAVSSFASKHGASYHCHCQCQC